MITSVGHAEECVLLSINENRSEDVLACCGGVMDVLDKNSCTQMHEAELQLCLSKN